MLDVVYYTRNQNTKSKAYFNDLFIIFSYRKRSIYLPICHFPSLSLPSPPHQAPVFCTSVRWHYLNATLVLIYAT